MPGNLFPKNKGQRVRKMEKENLYLKYSENKKKSPEETIYAAIQKLGNQISIYNFISDYSLANKTGVKITSSDRQKIKQGILEILGNYVDDHKYSDASKDKMEKWCSGLEAILQKNK
jgi:hypothetical protein